MNPRFIPQFSGALLRAFVRSQWIAAPVGLTLAALECISPDCSGQCFASAATAAWYIATPIAMILCLSFGL